MNEDLPRRIRERLVDPIALCHSLGLLERFKRQPGGLLIRCPVHEDASPSCSVTLGADGTIRWRCFACSASGDALTLVAAAHNIDHRREFKRVLEVAAAIASMDGDSPSQPCPPPRPTPIRATPEAVSDEVFAQIVAPLAYAGALDGRGFSAPVCEYLAGRGLLERARTDGWFAMTPNAGEMLSDMFGVELLRQVGLVGDDGRLRWAEHSLAIPWRNPKGLVQTIQRRHLGNCDAAKRYVFPTGRGPAHPYGIERLVGRGPIAITEGAIDVLAKRALDWSGWTTALGSPGVSGWRALWDELAFDRIVLIAFDADAAGDREALRLADRLYAAGAIEVRRSRPTRGKDWADSMRRSA